MAVVANTLIGKASGSVGNTTFSSWKGINVLKSKATTVANPRSDKQLMRRSAFNFLITLYRLLVAVFSLGFKEFAIKKAAYNAWVSHNLKHAFDYSVPPMATFIPENFLISKGTISDTPINSAVCDISDGECTITYPTSALLPGQSANDRAMAAVYNSTKNSWIGKVNATGRAAGNIVLNNPAEWEAGDVLHFYLGFINEEGQKASDSQYVLGAAVA